jgi:hypothetical protein
MAAIILATLPSPAARHNSGVPPHHLFAGKNRSKPAWFEGEKKTPLPEKQEKTMNTLKTTFSHAVSTALTATVSQTGLALVGFLSLFQVTTAQAADVETSLVPVCDTQKQMERLASLIGYNTKSAVKTVNVEAAGRRGQVNAI